LAADQYWRMTGIARAKRQGRTLGRPKRIFDREHARELARSGLSARAIAKQLGVSHTLIAQTLRERIGERILRGFSELHH